MAIEVNRRYLGRRWQLIQEPEIGIREPADIWEYGCEISRTRYAVPLRQRRRIFVD